MAQGTPLLSLIAPAHNEQANVDGLLDDVAKSLERSGISFEMIVVDDGSTDQTLEKLNSRLVSFMWLRVLSLPGYRDGSGNGQSAAFAAGISRARGQFIVLMDADRQNDPCDIPRMLQQLRRKPAAGMIQGDRSANRRDSLIRRVTSRVGRGFRRWVLGDTIRDTGCSLRIMRTEVAKALPLQFRGMHRFIPVYARLAGYEVLETGVNHRPRTAGVAKYGIWNRALPGLIDLLAVRWMMNRYRSIHCRDCEKENQGLRRAA